MNIVIETLLFSIYIHIARGGSNARQYCTGPNKAINGEIIMNDALTLSEYQQQLITQKHESNLSIRGFLERYLLTNKYIAAPLAITVKNDIAYTDCSEIEHLLMQESTTITKIYKKLCDSNFHRIEQVIGIV